MYKHMALQVMGFTGTLLLQSLVNKIVFKKKRYCMPKNNTFFACWWFQTARGSKEKACLNHGSHVPLAKSVLHVCGTD